MSHAHNSSTRREKRPRINARRMHRNGQSRDQSGMIKGSILNGSGSGQFSAQSQAIGSSYDVSSIVARTFVDATTAPGHGGGGYSYLSPDWLKDFKITPDEQSQERGQSGRRHRDRRRNYRGDHPDSGSRPSKPAAVKQAETDLVSGPGASVAMPYGYSQPNNANYSDTLMNIDPAVARETIELERRMLEIQSELQQLDPHEAQVLNHGFSEMAVIGNNMAAPNPMLMNMESIMNIAQMEIIRKQQELELKERELNFRMQTLEKIERRGDRRSRTPVRHSDHRSKPSSSTSSSTRLHHNSSRGHGSDSFKQRELERDSKSSSSRQNRERGAYSHRERDRPSSSVQRSGQSRRNEKESSSTSKTKSRHSPSESSLKKEHVSLRQRLDRAAEKRKADRSSNSSTYSSKKLRNDSKNDATSTSKHDKSKNSHISTTTKLSHHSSSDNHSEDINRSKIDSSCISADAVLVIDDEDEDEIDEAIKEGRMIKEFTEGITGVIDEAVELVSDISESDSSESEHLEAEAEPGNDGEGEVELAEEVSYDESENDDGRFSMISDFDEDEVYDCLEQMIEHVEGKAEYIFTNGWSLSSLAQRVRTDTDPGPGCSNMPGGNHDAIDGAVVVSDTEEGDPELEEGDEFLVFLESVSDDDLDEENT